MLRPFRTMSRSLEKGRRMSKYNRPTIGKLTNEIGSMWLCDSKDRAKIEVAKNIEIVPRRIVELIMGKCIEIEWEYGGDMNDEPVQFGKNCAASDILKFAESLLTEFETGGNE